MMHGTKKSYSSIVPAKPANKAERSAAESVEGDDGTKRNAERQSTVRTQGRKAVSQAQDRIREAVNRNKKEKLTAPASRQRRRPTVGLLQFEETGCTRHRWFDLGGLRGRL